MNGAEPRFRAAIGIASLVMLAISWPLWVGTDDFPRVPFVRGLPEIPAWLSWTVFGVLMGSVTLGSLGIASRATHATALLVLMGLIVQDQHRFQPWAYQYAMVALAFATTSKTTALGLARLFLIALYIHSGLSKCDSSFYRWMGPSFLRAGLYRFGVEPMDWPAIVREVAVRLMPVFEITVGLGLCLKRTRTLAIVGAVAMHLALVWILGPFGLNHSAIVLIWNAALIVEVLILFGMKPTAEGDPRTETRLAPLAKTAFFLAVLLPFGERAGIFDVWPSFALYASHPGRTRVMIIANDAVFPEALRDEMGWTGAPENAQRVLNLTNWSRRVRGTPIYPQDRAANGLAEAIAARYPEATVSVTQIGPAGANEDRSSVELNGLDAIRGYGDRSWINAHPAGSAWSGTRNAVEGRKTR